MMTEHEHKSLDTHYDGYKFRSRTEARWAVFFNNLQVQYQYEPEGFKFDDGECYLPDFYLPNVGNRSTDIDGIWVEVKGQAEPMHELDALDTASKLAELTGEAVAVLCGPLANGEEFQPEESGHFEADPLDDGTVAVDNHMRWLKCHNGRCRAVKYEFDESNYFTCEQCGSRCTNSHQDVVNAVQKARSARFEHGEKP
jgi:hypothetical protein